MKSLITRIFLCAGMLALLCGCATNHNVPLQEAFWQNPKQKITVVSYKAPEPAIHQIGQQGLLDMAITGIANKDLNKAVKATDLTWYQEIPQDFVSRLKQKQRVAKIHPRVLDNNRNNKKNHLNILAETDGDLLLTLELKAIGARREYATGFIPVGGPEGYCVMVGELIDPTTKKVLWHHETEIIQKVQGKWDEPPHFPNFKNALNLAITDAKQEIMDSFFSGH